MRISHVELLERMTPEHNQSLARAWALSAWAFQHFHLSWSTRLSRCWRNLSHAVMIVRSYVQLSSLPVVTLNERFPTEPYSRTIQSLHPSPSKVLDHFPPSRRAISLSKSRCDRCSWVTASSRHCSSSCGLFPWPSSLTHPESIFRYSHRCFVTCPFHLQTLSRKPFQVIHLMGSSRRRQLQWYFISTTIMSRTRRYPTGRLLWMLRYHQNV